MFGELEEEALSTTTTADHGNWLPSRVTVFKPTSSDPSTERSDSSPINEHRANNSHLH